jgi:hypothetical protein
MKKYTLFYLDEEDVPRWAWEEGSDAEDAANNLAKLQAQEGEKPEEWLQNNKVLFAVEGHVAVTKMD